jgi:dTDP-4-amino-4,6-dideoxygalactose transaminase
VKTPGSICINWAQPDINQDDFYSLKECFDSNWISEGKKVEEFENYVAVHSNRKYCVAVNSGTSALVALLIALGISNTSEVIIPAMSFIAVPHSITILGALPVLADIDKVTGMITPETVLPCISERTLAVIGIDYSGFTNDWSGLADLCNESGIEFVVDAASSFLARNNGKPSGAFGHAAIFSFHGAKPITTGEGGAIVTDDEKLATLLRRIRNHGEVDGCKYFYDYLGSNFRMTDITASLGISQVSRKDRILNRRFQVIEYYLGNKLLKEMAFFGYNDPLLISNGLTFTILHESRHKIKESLLENGIDTRIMWPYNVDQFPVYKQYPTKKVGELKNAREFSQLCLSLPVHSGIDKKQVDCIANIIKDSISTISHRR